MTTFFLGNLFLSFLNFFTLVVSFTLLWQGELDKYFDQKSEVIEKNKQIFLWIMFGAVGLINACIQYEKLRFEREKRRDLKLRNDLKEKELRDENN